MYYTIQAEKHAPFPSHQQFLQISYEGEEK